MAYTFTDHYRAVRLVLRLDGLIIGIGLGTLLLIYPVGFLSELGFTVDGPGWAARLGGSSLVGLGTGLIAAANERELRVASLLAAMISNGLMAISLFFSYFQGELVGLSVWGGFLLVLIFMICLLTTVMPIPYVRGIQRLSD